jgi:hypothetical protein
MAITDPIVLSWPTSQRLTRGDADGARTGDVHVNASWTDVPRQQTLAADWPKTEHRSGRQRHFISI